MESILANKIRGGNFSSSEIYKLLSVGTRPMTESELAEYKKLNPKSTKKNIEDGFGEAALTYIREKNAERRFGCYLTNEANTRETNWGSVMEERVFNMPDIGLAYTHTSNVTKMHPTIDYWCGSCDGTKEVENRAVFDFKAPFTRSSLYGLILPVYLGYTSIDAMNCIRNGFTHENEVFPKHKDGEKFYQQLVSNSIINNCDYAELIIYMPYQSELLAIYEATKDDGRMKWLQYASDYEVPFLPDGGFFKNLTIINFKVPQEDKDLLTSTVLRAGEKLIPRPIINQQS